MERQVGIGVIGMGWMGRVHASPYRRVLEHFPDLAMPNESEVEELLVRP